MHYSVVLKSTFLRNIAREMCKSAIRSETVRNVGTSTVRHVSFEVKDNKDFQERVKNSKVPVIVDFFAAWCSPSMMQITRLESVIAEKKGRVLLAKVDVDENGELAVDYEVWFVPVVIAMKNGKVEGRLVGLQDTEKLRNFVDRVVDENGL